MENLKFFGFSGGTSVVGKFKVEYLQHAAAKCSAKLKTLMTWKRECRRAT